VFKFYRRFYPPQSHIKASLEVFPGTKGIKVSLEKLESLGYPVVKTAWSYAY